MTSAISLIKTRSSTTASPAGYAGLHDISISFSTRFQTTYTLQGLHYWTEAMHLSFFGKILIDLSVTFRIGPREKYFHCTKCNLCLATDLKDNHKVWQVFSWFLKVTCSFCCSQWNINPCLLFQCVENVSRQNCPVCMEDIHTSRIGAHVLSCGHLLHKWVFDCARNNTLVNRHVWIYLTIIRTSLGLCES